MMMTSPEELVGQTELPGIGDLKFSTNSGPIYAPTQEISGSIEFRCIRPILLVRGVWIKLIGRQSVNVGTFNVQVDLFEGHEDHYLGGFHEVLYGYGEENVDTGGAATLFELREGTHKWNFALKIPENAPSSYYDQFTEVSYELTAVFDTPEVLMLASTLSYTPIIVKSLAPQQPHINDICLLGDRPSISFQTMHPSSSTMDLLLCNSNKRCADVADPKPFTDRDAAAILDAATPQVLPNNGRAKVVAAHTVLRVALVNNQSMSSSSSSSSSDQPSPPPDHGNEDHSTKASFDFTFMETKVKVNCSLATMCVDKPVSLEARLLVCVLLRSSSSRPFHSLRSLLQSPHSQIPSSTTAASATADMAASSSSSGQQNRTVQMHVRSTSDGPNASEEMKSLEKASMARRWLQRLGLMTRPSSSSSSKNNKAETAKDAALGWGACSVHQLWSRVVVLQTPEQPMAPIGVPLDVPVKIDPTLRSSCLSDWPRPSPLPHHDSHGAILHFTSRTSTNTEGTAGLGSEALFEYRVVLEVTAFELKGDIDAVYSSGDDVGGWEHRKIAAAAKSPLCRPCYAEIEVRAPPPSNRLTTALPSPTVPAITTTVAATSVAAAVQLLPPRQRSTSVHSLSGHPPRIAPTDNNNDNDGSAVLGIAEGRPLLVEGRVRIRSSSVVPELPPHPQQPQSSSSSAGGSAHADTENQNPNTTSARDRDHNPALIAAKVGVNRNSGRDNHPAAKKHKPLTPQAHPVKSVSRVTAELVSRGPAAVLRDRTAPVHRDVQITPSRFAPAVPVAQGAVVVLDDYLNNNNNEGNASASAQGDVPSISNSAMCTPRSSSTHETTVVAAGVFSPALAFLCSPRTTEMLLEQENRAAATPLSAVRGGGGSSRGNRREPFENNSSATSTEEKDGGEDFSPSNDDNTGPSSSSSSSMHQHESLETEAEATSSSASAVVAQFEEEEEKDQVEEPMILMSTTATAVQAVTLDDLPCSLSRPPPLFSQTTAAIMLSSSSVPVLREGIHTIGTPSMTTTLSLSSVGPQTRMTAIADNGCCYVPLPFIQPPDSAPPTARLTARLGHNDDDVMPIAGLLSPWTDSTLAEVHFTQNGRRLSFSNRDSTDQQQQPPSGGHENTMVVSEFLPLLGSPVALT